MDVTNEPDDAGFVQVIQGRGSHPERARALMDQDSSARAAFRPRFLRCVAVGPEGAYKLAVYLTSEVPAREGERNEPPAELQAQMEEMAALSVGEPEFFDCCARRWCGRSAERAVGTTFVGPKAGLQASLRWARRAAAPPAGTPPRVSVGP